MLCDNISKVIDEGQEKNSAWIAQDNQFCHQHKVQHAVQYRVQHCAPLRTYRKKVRHPRGEMRTFIFDPGYYIFIQYGKPIFKYCQVLRTHLQDLERHMVRKCRGYGGVGPAMGGMWLPKSPCGIAFFPRENCGSALATTEYFNSFPV